MWDLAGGSGAPNPLGEAQGTPVAVRFATTGVLAATAPEGAVQLWDPTTGSRLGPPLTPETPGLPLTMLSFSADGNRLAAAPVDGDITVWALDDPARPTLTTSIPGATPRGLAFDPAVASDTLAIVNQSGQLLIADADGAAVTSTRPGWGTAETDLAFAGDGSLLVTTGSNGRAAIWAGDRRLDPTLGSGSSRLGRRTQRSRRRTRRRVEP